MGEEKNVEKEKKKEESERNVALYRKIDKTILKKYATNSLFQ